MERKRPRQREIHMRKLLQIFFHWEVWRFAEEMEMSDDWLTIGNFLSWIGIPIAHKLEYRHGVHVRDEREIARIIDLVEAFARQAFRAFEKGRREGKARRATHVSVGPANGE